MSIPRAIAVPFGACVLAAVAVLGLAGAAARPGGVWLGVPGPASVVVVTLAAAVLAVASRGREGMACVAGLGAPVLLLLCGVPLAGLAAVSGPPLLVLAAAGLAVVLASLGWRTPRLAFLPLVFAILVCAAGRSSVRVGPQGDEPHYLMVADSLLRDGDLSLERDYAEGRYASFHDAPLAPHYRVRGRNGEIYSLHAVGLSLLILPAWALGGYPAVTVFMALLAALLVRELRQWVLDLSGREGLADAAAWVFALSPPLLHYAGLVFTEVPAGLALTFGLRRGGRGRLGVGGALEVGAAAALLPWLNVRYVPLAVLVVAHAVWRRARWRPALAAVAPLVASAVGIAFFHHALYGFWDPRRVYGSRPEIALSTLSDGLPGLLLDQEFGLLVYAPVLVLALPGLAALIRRDRPQGLVALVAVVTVLLTAGTWHMWRGGFNPPGRFLVPIAPVLFVAVALVWRRTGLTAGAALLVGWGLWTGIGGAIQPQLVHRDRDDTAPFFRTWSGAREWTGLLPGYVLGHPDRHRLAAIWAVALLAAVPWRVRALTGRRLAGAALGLALAAEAAAVTSTSSTGDRDAVRLVGRPAVSAGAWRAVEAAPAEWSPALLGWGPLYEPHRHPDGVPLGRRLTLAAGRYRLILVGRDLSSAGVALPLVEWAVDRPGAPWRRSPLQPDPDGLAAWFVVPAGVPAIDLRLRNGGPILLKGIRLLTQPSARGPV